MLYSVLILRLWCVIFDFLSYRWKFISPAKYCIDRVFCICGLFCVCYILGLTEMCVGGRLFPVWLFWGQCVVLGVQVYLLYFVHAFLIMPNAPIIIGLVLTYMLHILNISI